MLTCSNAGRAAFVLAVLITATARDDEIFDDHVHLMSAAATEHPTTKVILAHALNLHFRRLATLAMARTENPAAASNLYVDIAGIAPFYADSPERESIAWHLRKLGIAQELAGIRGGNLVRVLDEARKGARK